jgi:MFS family permease
MTDNEEQPLSRLDVLRGLHVATWEAIWAMVHAVLTTGAFQIGFALLLGASPFALGLLAGLPAAVGLLQLPASVLVERYGRRRPFVAAVSFPGRLLWGVILLIPFVLPRPAQLPAFLVLLTISSALMTVGVPAWTSWMSDLVPATSRGQYFARRSMLAGFVSMLVPLPAGAFLDQAVKYHRFDPRIGFAVLFAVACAAAVGSWLMILRQPEPPAQPRPNAESPLKSLAAPLTDPAFRRFLLFAGAMVFGQALSGQFFMAWQVDKKALALPYLTVQVLGAFAAGAGLLSTPLWGYLSDKYGSRPVLSLATVGVIVAPVLWLFTIPNGRALWLNVALIVVINLFSGASWAGVGLTQFNILLGVAAPAARATYTAVFSAITGTVGGVSPIVGGALMSALEPVAFHAGPVLFNNYKVLFFLTALIRIGCVFLVGRLADPEGRSARYVIEQLVSARPMSSYRSLRRLSAPVAEEERLEAVDRLADIRSPLAVEELVTALDDVSPDVRYHAAQALGAIGDARALPALIAKLTDPAAGIGELAADALGRIGDPSAAAALAGAARGPDARVRVAAIRALGHLTGAAEDPAVADALLASLDPSHPTACEAACAALTTVGASLPPGTARDALPRLLYLLSQEVDRGMRLASARALETLAERVAGEPGVFDTLRARLADETDPAVLAQEADTLESVGRAGGQGADTLLSALLPVLTNPSVGGLAYKQALEAVADVGLTPGDFYPYLGMNEMARDQAFSRLLSEVGRRLRAEGADLAERTTAGLLESYVGGDYAACLRRLADLTAACEPGPARSVLHALHASAPSRAVRAEEALLGILLLRECLAAPAS